MADPQWLKDAFADGRATEGPRTNLSALYGPSGGLPGPANESKYKSRKVEIDGLKFDSKKEGRRYLDLKAELAAGTISDLRFQVSFPLAVNGATICRYVADFVYVRDGRTVIEDVKSAFTRKLPVYRIKAKFMAAIGKPITEV